MKKRYIQGMLTVLVMLMVFTLWGETCEPNYTCPYFGFTNGAVTGNSASTHFNTKLSVGQPLNDTATNYSEYSTVTGFWSFYMNEPRPPIVHASDGDFQDMVLVEWTIEDDRTGPPVTGEEVQLMRNGYVYTTLPLSQTEYQDLSVFPGEYYEYGVVASNDMGISHTDDNIGFLNPNGVITGHIETPSGNPVEDAKVTLTPNMGRCSEFAPGEEAYIYFIDPETSVNRLFSGLEESYTIETWFRSIHTDHVQTIFSAVDSLTTDHYVKLDIMEGGYLRWQHNPTAGMAGTEIVTVNPYSGFDEEDNASWHHVACVFDSLEMTMYVDGFIVGENQATGYIEDQAEIMIGKSAPGDNCNYFYGRMDDMRIWNVAREWEDIRTYSNITLSGDEDGLSAYWKFDEVEGDIIFDLTDGSNDGEVCHIDRSDDLAPVFVGGVTDDEGNYAIRGIYFGNGTTFTVTPSQETNIGRALELNGTDQFVSFNGARIDLTYDFTLEGWFKTAETQEQTIFAAYDPVTDEDILRVRMNPYGNINCLSYNFGLQNFDNMADNLWHHYAVSYSVETTEFRLYLDGRLISLDFYSENAGTLSSFVMGKSAAVDDHYFNGKIDEVRLWNVCRTYDQITGAMNQPLEGDEFGLENYWKMNEGSDVLLTDVTGNLGTGTLENGVLWTEDIPLNEVFEHYYEPQSRQATLNHSNTAVDLINFTDISLIPVSGYIRYESSACFLEEAQLLVNGAPLVPPIYTDADGKWTVELEPGSVGDIIEPYYEEHNFTPPFFELPMIASPITGLYFSDQELREISGIVGGGSCEFPITPSQGEIEINVRAVNGCIEKTVVPDPETGCYEISELPPLIYQIWIDHPNPEIDAFFCADTLSLEDEDGEYDFIYYAPPEVVINDIPQSGELLDPEGTVIASTGLMAQDNAYEISIEIREAYTTWLDGNSITNYCPVDSGEVQVIDHINYDLDTTYVFFDGYLDYTICAKTPNILGGGEHPYQKEFTAIATDQFDRQATATQWAIVTGNRPRTTTFTTTTPEIPLMILRDPPGDGSSSTFSTTDSYSTSVGFASIFSANTSIFAAVHLGVDVTTSAGQFVFTDLILNTTMDLTATASVGVTNTDTYEQTWTLSTSETISTSSDDDFVGEEGDIYMGGAMNLLYGITDILNIEDGILVLSEDMMIAPSGFATNYVYSEHHILNTLIPSLYDIGDVESAELWQGFVDNNHSLKESASLIANRSFDAGAVYDYSETSETTESYSIGFDMEVATEIATEIGLEINGVGTSGGVTVSTQLTLGASYNNSETHSNTCGYTLTDNDIGDFFTVDVKWDEVYGTPVFDLRSGASSCPWEAETLKRNLPSLTISPSMQVNIPPNEPAVFTMQLGNLSESEEEREYFFRVDNASNPNGAQISVNGIYIEDYISYTVPYGQVIENTLSIERGPLAYNYQDLLFEFYPPEDEELTASALVSVEFQQAASEVHIAVPEDNWLVNSAHGCDTLWVTIDGYNRLAENLESIDLQYHQTTSTRDDDLISKNAESSASISSKNSEFPLTADVTTNKEDNSAKRDREWFTAFSVLKENIIDDYILMPWNISPEIVIDGNYELRAVTVSTGDTGNGYSNVVSGLIDRAGPEVFGSPQPTDGILGPDDNISVSFNENINGELISAGDQDITFWNAETGQMVDFSFTYGFNTITVEPGVSNEWIENRIMRVELNSLEDMYGNSISEPIFWEFFVNRNPVGWIGQGIDEVIYVDETVSTSRGLQNNGGSNRSYELIGGRDNAMPSGEPLPLPDWLNISPESGILSPGEETSISINLVDDISIGKYSTTIYASGVMGDEPLPVDIRILEYPPDWSIDITDFEYSMNMTAVLSIDDVLSADIYDLIGIFVDDQCRGIGEITYIPSLQEELGLHPYEAFISVYSNVMNGETLEFRVWDASEGSVLANINENYVFVANSVLGNPANPVSITATSQVIQDIFVNDGWNWLSFNLEKEDMTLNSFLESLSADTDDFIKSQSSFAQYVPDYGWIGNMTEIDNLSMYLLKVAEDDTLEITGYPVNVETDTLFVSDGWNWISYLPANSYDLNYALGSLDCLTTGDIIKSQAGFAQYIENMGWFGNMLFMQPQKGYLLRLTYSGELVYPHESEPLTSATDEIALCKETLPDRSDPNIPDWYALPQSYEHSMNAIAVMLDNGCECAIAGDIIAAFAGSECRGVSEAVYLPEFDRNIFFLTIYGDAQTENIELRYYNSQSGTISNITENIDFSVNEVLGSVIEPLNINTCTMDESDDDIPILETKLREVYPNPFNPVLNISYSLAETSSVNIVIYNIKGQKVRTLVDMQQDSGLYSIRWNGNNDNMLPASSGVYFISVNAENYHTLRKVLLMK